MKYYSCEKILSYNRIFNFIMGTRSAGKSFSFKKHCINKFLKSGKQFIYVRRRDTDIQSTAPTYFDDIAFMYPDHTFRYKGGIFYIDDQVAGYAIAVSLFLKYKSVAFPEVETIVFDEFISEARDYIGGKDNPYMEPELCLNFYQSVARGFNKPFREEVKFIFISNTVSLVNPYFTYFNIDKMLKDDTQFIKTDSWVLEICTASAIRDEIAKSQLGKLIANTKYGAYAMDNKFYLDSDEFIEEAPSHCWYQCTIIYGGTKYGLWEDKRNGLYYLNEKYDSFCKIVYSLDTDGHNVNTRLVARSGSVFKGLRNCFENGLVRFSSQRAKMCLMTFLNYG